MTAIIKINKADNVAVACRDIKAGESFEVSGISLTVTEDVGAGHKIALIDINKNEKVLKYGFPIGAASENIKKGSHVHCHNIKSLLGNKFSYEYNPNFEYLKPVAPSKFMGYKRPNGKVGIRNEVWIIPTVGCVNALAKQIRDTVDPNGNKNVFAYSHPYGCSQLGEDQYNTQKLLCGLINHPNAAGVLVLGLGCENNNIGEMKKVLGEYDENRVKFLNAQEVNDEIAEGAKIVEELLSYAAGFERTECDASSLVIGLKCGGSDGFSGITANPLVGEISDRVISMGGSAVLTEVPEMFGAETILMDRCINKDLFNDTVNLINNFKAYFESHGEPVDENPSPGNKAGGISTLADKSLGCTQKGGSAPVVDVLSYGMTVKKNGLSLLNGPGNDLVASCVLAASGAQIILFTTGRGTPFGCPVPTMKIASNSDLFKRKSNWMDFDAGRLLSGTDMNTLTDEMWQYILKIAEGETVKSEKLDKSDLAIFKDGVTL